MDDPDDARPEQPGARPDEPDPIRGEHVVGGILLGLVLALLVQGVLVAALSSTPAFGQSPVLTLFVALLPGIVGVALLLNRRTRQMGAGALLGVAVGSIVAAGVCTAIASTVMWTLG